MSKLWNEEEIKLLTENYQSDWDVIQQLFPNRTKTSIYKKIDRLGLKRISKRINDEDMKFIKENAKALSVSEIAAHLNVSRHVINRKMREMGINLLSSTWVQTDVKASVEDFFSIEITYEIDLEGE